MHHDPGTTNHTAQSDPSEEAKGEEEEEERTGGNVPDLKFAKGTTFHTTQPDKRPDL